MAKRVKQAVYELVYGINPVVELLRAKKRKLLALYTAKPVPKGWKKVAAILPSYPLPISYVTRDVLSKMVGTADHQGIVAHAQPFIYRTKPFDPARHSRLLMLDGIQDVRNLGAILRSAYCTGIQGVILGSKGCAPLNATALKASAGYAEHLDIYQASSLISTAEILTQNGYAFYLATFGGVDARELSCRTPLCLVVGAEGAGLTPQLSKYGTAITLPQRHSDISYNASVAAGILLFMISFLHE